MAELSLRQGSREWEEYRSRALNDLYFFCNIVLGYGQIVPMTLRAHYLMCRFAERQTGNPLLDEAWVRLIKVPRGVGKSTLITQGYSLQLALKYPDIAMLVVNETERGATKFLASIKQQITDNQFLRALFPERCPNDPEKDCLKWSESEVILPGRTSARKESTFQAIGVGGSITGLHPDIALVDDMISDEAMENARSGLFSLMDKTNRWISRLRPIVNTGEPHMGILFVGCLTGDSRVLMKNGQWKPIKDIVAGEHVYSWNSQTGQFAPQRVKGVYPQGEVETVAVDAGRFKLQCTPDHPFLAAAGRHRPVWRKAENLMDVLKRAETIRGLPEQPALRSVLEGWGEAEPDLLWLLGFLWGDGWLTKYVGKTTQRGTTYSICFAEGTDEALNERVRWLIVQYFGNRVYQVKGRVSRSENNRAGRLLESWGLTPGVRASEKRLPAWLFAAHPHEKREFLRGLLAADGHDNAYRGKRNNPFSSRLFTASKGLADDVRDVALTCGVRPTKIWHRQRMSQPPGSPNPVESHEYTVNLRFEEPGESLRSWRVRSVTPAGKAMVYDLSVEATENYVAEGFVVHNTPWWEDDSYAYVAKAFGYGDRVEKVTLKHSTDSGRVVVECQRQGDLASFTRPIVEDGTSWFPERWPDEKLAKMRVDDPLLYAANMMLDPRAPEITTFKPEWQRYFQWASPIAVTYKNHELKECSALVSDLDVIASVDPAFTVGGRAQDARQALVVTGGTAEGYRLVLLAQATRQTLDGFIADIVSACQRFKVKKLRLEKEGQQASFNQQVRKALDAAGVMISVVEESTGGKRKDIRIESLSPFFERGLIYAHRDQQDLLREYDSFPRGKLKDLLDALAAQMPHWQMGSLSNPKATERVQKELESVYGRMGLPVPGGAKKDWRTRTDGTRR